MARLLLIGLMFLFSGCATVVSGTTQTVFVETPKVNGASCKLNDSKAGVWYLPSTPGSATVRKGDGPMNIVCDKNGYETATTSVDETLVGATLGNIILGGGIGIFIDAASGAAQQYPDKIVVWMRPRKWPSAKEEEAWHRDKKAYEDEVLAKAKAASDG
ncbi:MAG: hypothetical protein HOA08_22425 [Rhodospirillaceae bacterium]|nr:hypothetical protein [Rhodospirillaceae bacterium]MBT3495249.1 hypothetical protein [Rhodospirillaceae bacterium]MBT3780282.1 hypothetical protein [Rhodospirillaceae bacterium]MBT3977339.1 hypothetical protein [Rhodospirillaceae bacterium]MBT4167313.1 hypothetical protein [Rhodospirillaceae bacterium]